MFPLAAAALMLACATPSVCQAAAAPTTAAVAAPPPAAPPQQQDVRPLGVEHCHRYRGTVQGPSLGPAFPANATSECEAACAANASCWAFTYTPGTVHADLAANVVSRAACTVYTASNIGDGNLPNTPTREASFGACCDLCAATAACASWTWASNHRTDS